MNKSNRKKEDVEYIYYYENKKKNYFVFSDMVISPNGRYLAASMNTYEHRALFLFDTFTNEQILSIDVDDSIRRISFSPDSKYILYPQEGKFVIRDLDGELVNEIFIRPTYHRVAWHPNGRYLVQVTEQEYFQLIDVLDGKLELCYEYTPDLYANEEGYDEDEINTYLTTLDAEWYPDGKRLLVLVEDKMVVHNFPRFKITRAVRVIGAYSYKNFTGKIIVFSKDYKYLALVKDEFEVFDGETLELIDEVKYAGINEPLFFDWSPHSTYGVYGHSRSSGKEFPYGVVRLWSFKEYTKVREWNLEDVPIRGYFHPKSKRIYILLRRTGVVSIHY